MSHRFVTIRFEAPLMSFGAPAVDQINPTDALPGRSMLTGLIANALGWDHADHQKLNALQARIHYGARADRPGEEILDYQTVELGQGQEVGKGFLVAKNVAWTTWGTIDDRKGGEDTKTGTHIRYRYYRAEAVVTVVLRLEPSAEGPTLDEVASALSEPARPLFIGRKACVPAAPLFRGFVEAEDAFDALLRHVPLHESLAEGANVLVWVPAAQDEQPPKTHASELPSGRVVQLHQDRDWRNQVHLGARPMREVYVPGSRFVKESP